MKLSLTLHGKTYSVESDEQFDGTQVSELVEQFKGLLVNAGYHPESVDQYFNTEYQWFGGDENE
jgi:Tat protein secretion system quality control protein TatD with DNase activity